MSDFPPLPQTVIDHLARFESTVSTFCDLINERASLPVEEFLNRVHELLARLYLEGLTLPRTEILFVGDDSEDLDEATPPSGERDPDRPTTESWKALYVDLGQRLGAHNNYREIFDPWKLEGEEEVVGSLADDLADIYGDLCSGLKKWRRGEHSEALWEWRYNFEIHWGERATGALRAIHALRADSNGGWPPAKAELPNQRL